MFQTSTPSAVNRASAWKIPPLHDSSMSCIDGAIQLIVFHSWMHLEWDVAVGGCRHGEWSQTIGPLSGGQAREQPAFRLPLRLTAYVMTLF